MEKGELKRQFFIAVFPPEWATEKIRKLTKAGPDSWEWKRPEDYHISLAFPGHLTERQFKKLVKVLEQIEHKAFNASFAGLSFYLKDPEGRNTSNHVIWARPDNHADNELRDLHTKIVKLLKASEFRTGNHAISPHLTVARPPPQAGDLTKEFAKAHGTIKAPSWRCDRFYICETLTRSHPEHPANNNGKGTRFKKVAEIRLAP